MTDESLTQVYYDQVTGNLLYKAGNSWVPVSMPFIKGDKGDNGFTGVQGQKGDKGDNGDRSTIPGPMGPAGTQGLKGDKGDVANITDFGTSATYNVGTSGNVIGKLNTSNHYAGAQIGTIVSVVYSSSIILDLSLSNNFDIGVLTGNVTLNNPINVSAGQSGIITIIQDSTGNRILSLGSNFLLNGYVRTAANSVTVISYYITTSGLIVLGCSGT